MRRIVLASTSPYRKTQLSSLGIDFTAEKPALDEESVKQQFSTPLEMAQGLARLKAESLSHPDHIVIGADQLVSLEGEILGKPHTAEAAVRQLLKMQGKTHLIMTAVCIVTAERNWEFVDITEMTMKSLEPKELENYVALDNPLDCAGSYKIEKNGRQLFSEIKSQDSTAIEGLPLRKLSEILQTLGYEIKKN